MLTVESPDVEAAVLAWARQWCELLAAGELEQACAQLDEPSASGIVWTPEAIRALVADTFSPETIFGHAHPEGPRFTSPRSAGGREGFDLGPFADGSGFWCNYDLPLNGAFSDLTAQFELHWRGPHVLAIRLHDLHVM